MSDWGDERGHVMMKKLWPSLSWKFPIPVVELKAKAPQRSTSYSGVLICYAKHLLLITFLLDLQ